MKPKYSQGLYKIHYLDANNCGGIIQYKYLINKDDYLMYGKEIQEKIEEIKNLTRKQRDKKKDELRELKKSLKFMFGSAYFLTGNYLHKAMKTGMIEMEIGTKKYQFPVKFEKIDGEILDEDIEDIEF